MKKEHRLLWLMYNVSFVWWYAMVLLCRVPVNVVLRILSMNPTHFGWFILAYSIVGTISSACRYTTIHFDAHTVRCQCLSQSKSKWLVACENRFLLTYADQMISEKIASFPHITECRSFFNETESYKWNRKERQRTRKKVNCNERFQTFEWFTANANNDNGNKRKWTANLCIWLSILAFTWNYTHKIMFMRLRGAEKMAANKWRIFSHLSFTLTITQEQP